MSPNYDMIHFMLVWVSFLFRPNVPIFNNVAFWASFAMADFDTIVKAIDVCKACEASKRKPAWDCAHTLVCLSQSLSFSALSVYFGWELEGTPHEPLKDSDTAVKKRHVFKRNDIWIVMFLVVVTVLPLMVLVIDMNYPIVDLVRWTLNYLKYT